MKKWGHNSIFLFYTVFPVKNALLFVIFDSSFKTSFTYDPVPYLYKRQFFKKPFANLDLSILKIYESLKIPQHKNNLVLFLEIESFTKITGI